MPFVFPIVSICFYAAWIFAVFLGGKRADENSFNSDFLSIRATRSLQGLAAFGVICHHISQTEILQKSDEIQIFKDVGFLFTGLFFFVSGYGLLKSLDSKRDYLKGFLKRRCVPIIVSFYAMNFLYIIWHLILRTPMSADEWICKILGIALLNDNAWFVPVILILYVSFYFAFKKAKNRRRAFAMVFIVVVAQIALFLFLRHFPWWHGEKNWWRVPGAFSICAWWKRPCALWFEGEWWVNSTVCFLLGMFFAQGERKIFAFFSKNYWVKFFASFALALIFLCAGIWALSAISYWREFGGDNSVAPRLKMILIQTAQVVSFVIFVAVFMMKFFADNRVTRFFGKHSLEIYLMQAMAIRTLPQFFGFEKMNLALFSSRILVLIYAALSVAISILLALGLKKISSLALNFFGGKKNV